jgi:hypothetical protein
MKIDLPSSNKHLHIEDFLDLIEVERYIEYMCISGGIQVQRKSFCLVGASADFMYSTRKGAHDVMPKTEATPQVTVLTIEF